MFSYETIRQKLKKRGLVRKNTKMIPMLSDVHKAVRVSGQSRTEILTGRVVSSDEMSIWLAGGRLCLWCKKDEIGVKLSKKHSPKLHVWGAFSATGTFPLKIFRDNLTGIMCSNILNECLVITSEYVVPRWVSHSLEKFKDPNTHQRSPRKSRK